MHKLSKFSKGCALVLACMGFSFLQAADARLIVVNLTGRYIWASIDADPWSVGCDAVTYYGPLGAGQVLSLQGVPTSDFDVNVYYEYDEGTYEAAGVCSVMKGYTTVVYLNGVHTQGSGTIKGVLATVEGVAVPSAGGGPTLVGGVPVDALTFALVLALFVLWCGVAAYRMGKAKG